MDFKVNRELIPLSETVYDGVQEQSVELDYILPDYFPDIFKLVKCFVTPTIISWNAGEDRIAYELSADIKIMYCAEQSNQLQCIQQKMMYSKTIELPRSCEKPDISFSAKTDYANCRVVNQRRIDLRSAITIKARVMCERTQEVICDAFGMNIQLKKNQISYAAKKLFANKTIEINEDLELGTSKPSIISIVRNDVIVTTGEKKIIANKMIVKGEAALNILYSCEKDGAPSLEAMQFTLPYSQIMDMDGLDESFVSTVKAEAVSCVITPVSNKDGEYKLMQTEISIRINCCAVNAGRAELVTDAYSTAYSCDFSKSPVKISMLPIPLNESHQAKETLEYKDGSIECVYDVWCRAGNTAWISDEEEKQLKITGTILYMAMIKNENGTPVLIERESTFEHSITMPDINESYTAEPEVKIMSCSYNLASSDSIQIKADIKICGSIYSSAVYDIITELNVCGENKKIREGDYALKLYYAEAGEDIWKIAKKYSTSVSAIMEENELASDKPIDSGMLLIPIVS